MIPIRANFEPLPFPFAFPEAECSEAIRDLDPSERGEDPGSSRSDFLLCRAIHGIGEDTSADRTNTVGA